MTVLGKEILLLDQNTPGAVAVAANDISGSRRDLGPVETKMN
jgi:hypothetical protein